MCKKIIKIVAGLFIFAVMFFAVQEIVTGAEDLRTAKRLTDFYESEEDTIDVVYIGSSSTYAFWVAPYAWYEYGITVFPYTSQNQSPIVAKYLIEETMKTQPNAKFIINLSSIHSKMNVENFHYLVDNMPNSLTKFKMIRNAASILGYSVSEEMECYFPIIRYHDRWKDLSEYDFEGGSDGYMSGPNYNTFLNKKKDVSGRLNPEDYYEELPKGIENSMKDLLQYIEDEKLKDRVMFVIVPQASKKKDQLGRQNAVKDMVEKEGYTVFDMQNKIEEIGLDFKTDYYNRGHCNIHGAIKITSYMSKYLIKEFDLKDKRGDKKYEAWDIAFKKYYDEQLESRMSKEEKEKYFTTPIK